MNDKIYTSFLLYFAKIAKKDIQILKFRCFGDKIRKNDL